MLSLSRQLSWWPLRCRKRSWSRSEVSSKTPGMTRPTLFWDMGRPSPRDRVGVRSTCSTTPGFSIPTDITGQKHTSKTMRIYCTYNTWWWNNDTLTKCISSFFRILVSFVLLCCFLTFTHQSVCLVPWCLSLWYISSNLFNYNCELSDSTSIYSKNTWKLKCTACCVQCQTQKMEKAFKK